MPSDLVFKTLNAVHRGALRISGGRLGWTAGGMPVVELTTTGRRSGQPRTVMLTSPLRDGETIVLVASRGGDDRHPAWLLNVRDHPEVEVAMGGGPPQRMNARIADADERARLWPLVVARYKHYGDYQTRTDREIPLVLVEPGD
jgi:deazaflavin-dependent oxidoreductase (nitroreductase family)